MPIYRFSYQEEQNSLFYDTLKAPTHVKLVWNIASAGFFWVSGVCPLLLFPSALVPDLENIIPDISSR